MSSLSSLLQNAQQPVPIGFVKSFRAAIHEIDPTAAERIDRGVKHSRNLGLLHLLVACEESRDIIWRQAENTASFSATKIDDQSEQDRATQHGKGKEQENGPGQAWSALPTALSI